MATFQNIQDALNNAREIRLRVLDDVTAQSTDISNKREEQVKLSQDERSRINFLAFAIVATVLGISPESLHDPFVVIGLVIILFNAFLFGFVADCIQRNNNVRNCERANDVSMKNVEPYYEAYDEMAKYPDCPQFTTEGFQQKFTAMQDAYVEYLEVAKMYRKPRIASKTKLAIGYWYFVIFAFGIIILGTGLIISAKEIPGYQESVDIASPRAASPSSQLLNQRQHTEHSKE